MSDVALTPTSYLVLGLVAHIEPCTPYDMKRLVAISIGHFWSFPHSQLYAEPARLAEAGLLDEDQEPGGRRRKRYRITPAGKAALCEWLCEPTHEVGELRELGVLKLFFSSLVEPSDIAGLAAAQREAHERALEEFERIRDNSAKGATPQQLATLELGFRWHRMVVDFWADVERHPPGS